MRRSAAICFLIASVALLFADRVQCQPPALTVEISDRVPRVGDAVTFTCRVTGLSSGTLTLNKVIVQSDAQFLHEQIALNDVLVRPYKDLARYAVTRTTDGEGQQLNLQITGVQIEDSGHYACAAPGIDNLYVMEILAVYRKPENVSFVGFPPTGAVVVLREDVKVNLTCVIPDVLPIPSVQLWLQRNLLGPKDITNNFLVASDLNILCPGNPLDKKCPVHMSYTMRATNREFVPSYENDGKELTCTATSKQFDHDTMSSTIQLAVLYPPKFVCAGLWNGTVNMTDLRVICKVYANPPSSRTNKSVTIKAMGTLVLVRPGDNTPQYSLEDKPLVPSNLKVTSMEFVIKTVTEEHFSYVYYLHATNEAGNTTKTITITNSITPIEDGADSMTSANIFAVIMSIVFALAFNQL